jgi:hypothetical protein
MHQPRTLLTEFRDGRSHTASITRSKNPIHCWPTDGRGTAFTARHRRRQDGTCLGNALFLTRRMSTTYLPCPIMQCHKMCVCL